MALRGQLTPRIAAFGQAAFGHEFTQRDLRLIPYLHSVIVNRGEIDMRKINEEEWKRLQQWEDAGLLVIVGDTITRVTPRLWMAINHLLWLGYATHQMWDAEAPAWELPQVNEWAHCLDVANVPQVHEALGNFSEDSTEDNAVALIQKVLGAVGHTITTDKISTSITITTQTQEKSNDH